MDFSLATVKTVILFHWYIEINTTCNTRKNLRFITKLNMNSKHLKEALIESTYISLELKELKTYLKLSVFTTEHE